MQQDEWEDGKPQPDAEPVTGMTALLPMVGWQAAPTAKAETLEL